jgi:hypothetical protein
MHVTVTVELLKDDENAQHFLDSLKRSFEFHCSGLTCTVRQQPEFEMPRSFKDGAVLAIEKAVATADLEKDSAWSVYLCPRDLQLRINGTMDSAKISSVMMVVAHTQRPVGIFLNTFTNGDIAPDIERELDRAVATIRDSHIERTLDPSHGMLVEQMRDAVLIGCMGALTKRRLN